VKLRSAVTAALLVFVLLAVVTMIVKETRRSQHAAAVVARSQQPAAAVAHASVARPVVRVTYFHTTTRCVSCYKIEALAQATVQTAFAAQLAQGDLVWSAINVDEPGNEHYIDDYRLFTKSVIVSEVVGEKEVRFRNLDRVWELLGDEQAFARYVADEVGAFLEHP
jgi:hypothetical protein